MYISGVIISSNNISRVLFINSWKYLFLIVLYVSNINVLGILEITTDQVQVSVISKSTSTDVEFFNYQSLGLLPTELDNMCVNH